MNQKILIIEDDEQDQKIMKRVLISSGFHEILFSNKGEAGIELAKTEKPDLVIIDTILPGMSGFDVCQRITDGAISPKPKMIVMTGFIDAVDAVRARKCGADDYCAKTSDFKSLVEAIKNCLNQ
ncbi:MAG: hypothetical protein A3G33_06175 [Omnitrophica bacterium RIFCSPLOWO2_12_FULL_44_17]|uniref:Response regulatory domain-containing protein n=1 Tax=Candidatus Danuiimicrobium aquiferis TaxID=1801832 RepID=A0A1G1KQZ4_9BACT|nr:MAG: hypothetical protein A3B72_02660 [Omnitrophica bacterium RIFCSPHIGHO2_02_FULL_45_28]OGW88078.1 MAG: hypothetical protein A3E74_00620 [Omnitrophica bacterium RIFCSPHIGHO2_12_FULL_44_12]OGW95370.1 MAG: hypothetical protein A3G33_06175 [Omnitrophica bacterium RIFCSPLOWO2_12_FULL_44_17]OGX04072.1 MAG: hypothetical protein A3J12_08740 [Omnitrophica bacterium RIFCSPLOWO2_02_FULL_44_11]